MKTAERLYTTKFTFGTTGYKCKTMKNLNSRWAKHGWKGTKINQLINRGSGGRAPPFLTSVLDRGKWSASGSGRFNPRGKN
jgi:hypothetical protein